MMRVRYEAYCGGRLLKVFDQVDVTSGPAAAADGTEFVDGQHRWKIDEQWVSVDVAEAMLRAAGETPRAAAKIPDESVAGEGMRDWDLLVTVRVYGDGSAMDAAGALCTGRGTFDLPGDGEVEILSARPWRVDDGL